MSQTTSSTNAEAVSVFSVFLIFLRLGLTSFGGPVAHLGFFRNEFVDRRRWLSDQGYSDLVALCQFLPGPASSQVGMGIGLTKAGYGGAIAAWLGFTMPSAIVLILLALGLQSQSEWISTEMLRGLKMVAVAVVAQAVWGMAQVLCPDRERATLMVVVAAGILLVPSAIAQVTAIVIAGLYGVWRFRAPVHSTDVVWSVPVSRRAGLVWLTVFLGLLAGLPLLAWMAPTPVITMVDSFFRTGALVFGGGHVVLPLLQAEVVPNGLVSQELFLAGYGAAQAVPGPLFTFSAFLGASAQYGVTGWSGGLLALAAIFLPSFLLVFGALPFWQELQHHLTMRSALVGINAAVVGLLLAALYHPVWTSAIHQPFDFVLALAAFIALVFWRLPPGLVVLLGVAITAVI